MPAYNFKARFAARVESGQKPYTIRPRRQRPTKPGDTLFLYTGQRTSECRLLRTETCVSVTPITIDSHGIECKGVTLDTVRATNLAIFDGFISWPDMRDWFDHQYGLPTENMEIIRWDPESQPNH